MISRPNRIRYSFLLFVIIVSTTVLLYGYSQHLYEYHRLSFTKWKIRDAVSGPVTWITIRQFIDKVADIGMTSRQRAALVKTLNEFDRFWRKTHNKTYFLFTGSLLGAYRHSDIVPWDNDIDIMVDEKDHSFLASVVQESSIFGEVYARTGASKFYLRDPKMTKPIKFWRWPFVDVLYFDDNGTHLSYHDNGYKHLRKRDIFPLIEMPFGDRMQPVPRCPFRMIKQLFGDGVLEICQIYHYSHQFESLRTGKQKTVPCQMLQDVFPFTEWKRLNTTHVREWILPPKSHRQRGLDVYMPEC